MAKDVRCPFYKKDDGVKICCEGIDDKTSVHIVFPSSKDRRSYQLLKCCQNYNTCLVAAMNNKKWEGK